MRISLRKDFVNYISLFLLISLLAAFHLPQTTRIGQQQTNKVIKPPFLAIHDTVGVIAPAFGVNQGEEALKLSLGVLRDWGLQVILGQSMLSKYGALAGEDSMRRSDLQVMLDDPNIKAVFAYRGGYGTTRIIDGIDFSGCLQYPKWLIGFSDITTIHFQLHQLGIVSIHGEMLHHFTNQQYKSSLDSLKALLFGQPIQIKARLDRHNRLGTVQAPVVGGNLAMICTNIGTPSDLDTNGKILVLEEIDEKLYAIDRMLVHLKRAGKLAGLAGLVVGNMVSMKDNAQNPFGKDAYSIIKEHIADYSYPVAFNFPIGHTPPNIAFPHGAVGQLTVLGEAATLTFNE